MGRLNHEELVAAATELFEATPDESGQADLVSEKGAIVVGADPGDFKSMFKRIKKVEGYRWAMINADDLFAANTLSLGSKAGLIAPDGKVMKKPDIPRKKT